MRREDEPAIAPELVEVDEMAARALRAEPIPAGVVERIFEASVSELAAPAETTELRLVGEGELPPVVQVPWHRRATWRVAGLAAAVVLALFIGYMVWPGGIGVTAGPEVAENDSDDNVAPDLGQDIPFVPLEYAFEDDLERDMEALQEWMASATTTFETAGLGLNTDYTTSDLGRTLDDLEDSINSF